MIKRYLLFGILFLGWLGCSRLAAASVEVDLSFFYDSLAVHGNWSNHPQYGWVWSPTEVEVNWRPYTRGHWVWTDDYGWLWVSDFEWGWGPFHYGRWFFEEDEGWLWIPGYDWGPSWVAWRSGGGYFGWAPLPPQVHFDASVGLQLGGFDFNVGISHPAWVFCEESAFLAPTSRPSSSHPREMSPSSIKRRM